jgi:hypothetical protein
MLGALAVLQPAGAAAQDAPPMPPPGAWENPGTTAIQVNGNLGAFSFNNPISGGGAAASRVASSDARRFVRCIHHAPAGLLRPIVEGHSRDPGTRDALDRVIRTNSGCYQGYAPAAGSAPSYYGRCNPVTINDNSLCRSVYDRGALVEDAFNTYAPKFMLMPADTLSDAVVARFAAREEARGKFRSPMDRRFYDTVACMVRLEPQRATRLLRAEPGLEREARIRGEIILRTRKACANNARVKVDGFQFRAYLADALYHWTLAAKNVETLVTSSR